MNKSKTSVFILGGDFLGLEMARELNDAGYSVTVVGHGKNDIALHTRKARGISLPLPDTDPAGLLEELLRLAQSETGLKVLLGVNEKCRKWISEYHKELAPEFKTLSCETEILESYFDKWNQMQMSASADVSAPNSAILDKEEILTRKLKYPLIIKPRYCPMTISFRDKLGTKVLVAHDRSELKDACQKIKEAGFSPLIQEMVPGVDFNQFLFGAAVKDGKPYAICMMQKVKTDPWPYGSGVIVRTIYHQELYEAGCKMLADSGYSGICDIEFMRNWDTGGFDFIEFNPRYGLGQRVSQTAGAGLAEMAVKLATGEAPDAQVIARPGYFWVYFDEWIKERIMPWRNQFTRQLRNRGNTSKIFDIMDCRPELRHIKNIASSKLKRVSRLSSAIFAGAINFGEMLDELGKILA
ncbi:MAG: NAD-binding protein [bacterium]|nr:NAD-binding protein [bacterium]